MAKIKSQFVCQQCGYSQSQWAGRCPTCDTWNSLVETVSQQFSNSNLQFSKNSSIVNLQDIKVDEDKRQKTGELELDNVLGGGLVDGMVVLVAGEPGIGKSTLLLQVALKCKDVLYICGEESATQVALRAKRLGKISEVSLLETNNVDEAIAKITETKPDLVIVESIHGRFDWRRRISRSGTRMRFPSNFQHQTSSFLSLHSGSSDQRWQYCRSESSRTLS